MRIIGKIPLNRLKSLKQSPRIKALPKLIFFPVFIIGPIVLGIYLGYRTLQADQSNTERSYLELIEFPITEGGPQYPEEKDPYVAFAFDAFDLIRKEYWNPLTEEQVYTLAVLAIENITEETQDIPTKNRDTMRELFLQAMEGKSDEEKEEFVAQIVDVVLINLEPFGRSRLFSIKQKKALENTVKNVTGVDRYAALGLEEDAPQEDIESAREEKVTELESQEQTEEVKKEISAVKEAYEVLKDEEARKVYDESGVETTIKGKLLNPRTFYIHIEKFSPTTLTDLERVTKSVDEGDEIDTLIIDLRANLGGAIDLLPYFLGPFIGQDQSAYNFFSKGQLKEFRTLTGWMPSLVRYKRVVVLTDERVQSSGEVFVSVLKKYKVGTLVGKPTMGWGTVERVFQLNKQISEDENYSVFLVHTLTLREDGTPIQGQGVAPDIDTDDTSWKTTLNDEFDDWELVNLVADVLNRDPGVN